VSGLWAAVLLALPLFGVSRSGARAAAGDWGGLHLRVSVDEKGASLDFDCAHGRISEPLVLGDDGRFEVKGVYAPERPGPILRDEAERGQPARYRGSVKGDVMTLHVSFGEGDAATELGPYELTHGKPGRVFKCK
jgi:hypothetical protein